MKISIDNGHTFFAQDELPDLFSALDSTPISWDTIVFYMDDATREQVVSELAPCTEEEFLSRYLQLAPSDLVIG